ncbi:MAG: SpoIID/LytB domain-containing protein [Bacteroidetes bacterium]|nr:SpoIID/LytB domain-containing protein [Bacteroidota bacterium]
MFKGSLFFVFLFSVQSIFAHHFSISIFSLKTVHSATVNISRGSYNLFIDSANVATFKQGETLKFAIEGSKIRVHYKGTSKLLSHFKLTGEEYLNNFKIGVGGELRTYEDNLICRAEGKSILLLNDVELEHYIAGVVESEAGLKAAPEYFKLQAILCRTYALKNFDRHALEGFNLCDNVHCQAYYSKSSKIPDILKATTATNGLIITDDRFDLINATFHSNCGGQTCNSEDVWLTPLPYLRSVKDTFCVKSRNARWEKIMTKNQWQNYLMSLDVPKELDTAVNGEEVFFSPDGRQISFYFPGKSVKTTKIRTDLKLKSAYFKVEMAHDSVFIQGRGYGHGVGLCQEGAMQMAKEGYAYNQIIGYYFAGVFIVNLNALEFFKEE